MHSNLTIQNELNELNSILAGIPNTNIYTVPDGYFEAMLQDILHTVHQPSPFMNSNTDIPTGYFEGLADVIMNKIKDASATEAAESPLLLSLKSLPTYEVPPGYFEGFSAETMDRINTPAAESEGSTWLHALKNNNTYSVPQRYFNGLATDIISKLPVPAKVIVMRKRSSFFNYAAAAVITGLLGLSLVSVLNNKNTDTTQVQTAMVESNIDEGIDKALSTVSDADIVAYLKESGEDVNAALVASVSETNNLPEQVDYLTDDKTLDNLLQNLNIKDQSATN